ncbi:MAG: DNA-processing protein DprA [Propionibacteriaceae bacterium]|jgi:DNA processing protein|nr:DNA-processing protein DprA [Propionibacteriaceae bacterium]
MSTSEDVGSAKGASVRIEERLARVGIAYVTEPGDPAVSKAVADFGAEAIWEGMLQWSGQRGLKAREYRPEAVLEGGLRQGLRYLVPGDDEWPRRLTDLANVVFRGFGGEPLGLWVKGSARLGELADFSVGMVGSRSCTSYGERQALELAHHVSDSGVSVISGGAFGIDAAAHRGAMSARTPTVAVLANGLDEYYPAGNAGLFERICEEGLLVSELAPGEHPTRVRFLIRNRLIAALSIGTLVVEGAARSGTQNTMNWASELGRVSMAVPGPVSSVFSYTPHELIRSGQAVLVTHGSDILELIAPGAPEPVRPEPARRRTDGLEPAALAVYEAIPAKGSRTVGELSAKLGFSVPKLLSCLGKLEEGQLVVKNPRGAWQLC